MPRVALLGWEYGRGLGHAIPLIQIAQALTSRGWRCVLALRSDLIPEGFDVEGFEVCAAPIWGGRAGVRPDVPRSSASMTDVLAGIGFCSAEWVERQVAAWRALFAEHKPDLLVTDHAPGAVLAARGRVPCLATGTGYTVPPAGLTTFPLFHTLSDPVFAEKEVLDTVNAALAKSHTEPLQALSQAMTGDASCVCTLPFLDPYAEHRTEEVLGPLLKERVYPRAGGATEIFCYLREPPREARLDDLVSAIVDLPRRTVAFLPGLSPTRRAWLRDRGVTVLDGLASLNEQLSRSCLLIHPGGHGMAAAAVLAGVPQIVTSFDVEKWLTGRRLVGRGIAQQLDYQTTDARLLRAAILAALDDPVMDLESRQASEDHAAFTHRNIAESVADSCQQLAG